MNTTTLTTTYFCTLERAFKAPMLCDVTKVHGGYFMMPAVTDCTEDETWGKIGGYRKVFMKKNFFFRGGEAALDMVLARVENEYWKIEISDFKFGSMGFLKFQAEWFTRQLENGKVEIRYKYYLFSKYKWQHPFHWIISKTLWRKYMKHVLENIPVMAEGDEPFVQE